MTFLSKTYRWPMGKAFHVMTVYITHQSYQNECISERCTTYRLSTYRVGYVTSQLKNKVARLLNTSNATAWENDWHFRHIKHIKLFSPRTLHQMIGGGAYNVLCQFTRHVRILYYILNYLSDGYKLRWRSYITTGKARRFCLSSVAALFWLCRICVSICG